MKLSIKNVSEEKLAEVISELKERRDKIRNTSDFTPKRLAKKICIEHLLDGYEAHTYMEPAYAQTNAAVLWLGKKIPELVVKE